MKPIPYAALFQLLPALCLSPAVYAQTPAAVHAGSTVTIEYTLTTADGTQVDGTPPGQPLVYTQGNGELLPAVEQALAGAHAGERRRFTLAPEQAYGPVVPDYVQEIDLQRLPPDARQPGASLVISNASGEQHSIRVKAIHDGKAVIDFNHPLAGQTLHFDIHVLSVH